MPAIRASTGAGAAEVQWVVNVYTLPLAALILLGGALGDHHGRRLWLVIGTALFGIASLVCALERLARDAARRAASLQGIGAALLLPNSLALLNGAYEGEARGQAIGTWAAAGAIAAAIAPLIGGWLVETCRLAEHFLHQPAVGRGGHLRRADPGRGGQRAGKGAARRPSAPVLATLGLGAATYGLTLWSQTVRAHPDGVDRTGRRARRCCSPSCCGSGAWATRRWFR